MEKKGASEGMFQVIFIVLIVLFFIGMLYFIFQYRGGAAVFEDYYAKEIVKVIDLGEVGDKIQLDVHRATGIALRNEVGKSEMFGIDNVKNEVCVKLSKGKKTCYSYFNDVDVFYELKFAASENENGEIVNVLDLKFKEVQKRNSGGEDG